MWKKVEYYKIQHEYESTIILRYIKRHWNDGIKR
jgi:hypothetical protein